MRPVQIVSGEADGVDDGDGINVSGAELFAIVWDTLADVLGTAAAAAIVRRAVGRAPSDNSQLPELDEIVILRENLGYRYALPNAWAQKMRRAPIALRALVAELGRLLIELTGTVVIGRLEQIPELVDCGLLWRPTVEEEAN